MVAPLPATMQEIVILNFYHEMRLYKMNTRGLYIAILPYEFDRYLLPRGDRC